MVKNIPDIFIENGTEKKLSVVTPFVINNPSKVYYLHKGSINLSSTRFVNGSQSGKLYNFTLLYENEIFFGFKQENSDSLVFFADAEENSIIYELSLITLIDELKTKKSLESKFIPYIEKWVIKIYDAINEDTTIQSPSFKNILKYSKSNRCKADEYISTNKDIIWIETNSIDHFLFNGHIPIPENKHIFFPITKRSFLKTCAPVNFTLKSTKTVLASGSIFDTLFTLHKLVLQSDQYEAEQYKKISEEWIKKKYSVLNKEFNHSLSNAQQVIINPKKFSSDGKFARVDNILFQTCIIVADYKKIHIVLPPSLEKSHDPIGEISRYSGIRYREILLEDDWYKQIGNDCFLGFLKENNSPIAIIPDKSQYKIIDLGSNQTISVNHKNKDIVGKVCYSFYKPLPKRNLNVKDLLSFAFSNSKMDIGRLIFTAIFSALLALALPILTAFLFDDIIPNAQRSQLLHIAYALIMAALGGVLFETAKYISILRLRGLVDSNLQVAIWDRILDLPTEFFRKYTAGDLAERSIGITHMLNSLSSLTISTLIGGVFSVINFGLLFYYSTTLGSIALLLSILFISSMFILGFKQVKLQRQMLEEEGKISGFVLQLLTGISILKVTGNETKGFIQWFNKFNNNQKVSLLVLKIQNNQRILTSIFYLFALSIIYYSTAKLSSDISTGKFLSFNAAFGGFIFSMIEFSGGVISALKIVPIYNRMKPILNEIPENSGIKDTPHQLRGDLEVNNLIFRYDNTSPYILKDVSIKFNKGEFVALVGPSGSGKSTIIRLLLGFNQPEVGTILYDGHDLKNMDIKLLRKQIGVVLQDGNLIAGDIYSNIVGSAINLSLQDAWDAAKAAAFDKDIESMPMGMFTIVNDEGGTLSGGQKQRLMIARALVNKPKILIFDEATSALDNRTQAIVTESLNKLQVTRIVVAHRLSTIVNADKIVYLENGEVLECGNFESLMGAKGKFYNLALRQIE